MQANVYAFSRHDVRNLTIKRINLAASANDRPIDEFNPYLYSAKNLFGFFKYLIL